MHNGAVPGAAGDSRRHPNITDAEGPSGRKLPRRVQLQRVHGCGHAQVARLTSPSRRRRPAFSAVVSPLVSGGLEGGRRRGRVYRGHFWVGAVGLAVAEGSRRRGAAKIIGVDLNLKKFEIGKKFGLTDFVNPTEIGEKSLDELVPYNVRVIKEMTNGGADYCFECIGLALMKDAAVLMGAGKPLFLGWKCTASPCPSNLPDLEGRCIMGSLFGGIKAKVTFQP
ncbi:hypothetical protein HPP92_010886 [Vanilla planifolia]|uniref:Alcohol dehydrogenase-like C-terminal domain-containing protein n=1 Tax=Vanilla planifolia TaxID=51239 RepID=A0A835R5H5_VANPL|nr:hypothetical protein HPP92_011161 [Vanilla planifolia]KAG0482802.1 hypothetical protein HPP92_010886 [Vanilla planifolia]